MRKLFMTVLFAAVAMVGMQAQIIKSGQENKVAKSLKDGFHNVIDAIDQDVTPTGTHEVLDGYFVPRLGLCLSTMTSMGGNPKLSVVGGFGVEIFVKPRLAVGLEMMYNHQGTSGVYYDAVGEDGNKNSYGPCNYSFRYFSINPIVRYYPRATMPLSVYAGLSVSRCVGAKFTRDSEEVNLYKKGDVYKGDFGFPVGVTYEIGQWGFDLRYCYSPFRQARSERAREIMGNASHMKLEATVTYRILLF